MTDIDPQEIMPPEESIYAFAASPDFDFSGRGVCFAGSSNGLLYSKDGGRSWKDAFTSLKLDEPIPTLAIAISPTFTPCT